MLRLTTIAVCIVVAFSSVFLVMQVDVPEPSFETSVAPTPSLKQLIEQDLVVRAVLGSDRVIRAGERPWIEATLVNTSKTVSHWAVQPGDGSYDGRREPYVYCAAFQDIGNGLFKKMEPSGLQMVCGIYDSNWETSIVKLNPRDGFPLEVRHRFEFQQSGRYRLQVNYAYDAGERLRPLPPERLALLGDMASVPRFEINSNAVEFEVIRPVDIRVDVKKRIRMNETVRLSELLNVTLMNCSGESIQCTTASDWNDGYLQFETGRTNETIDQYNRFVMRDTLSAKKSVLTLGSGESKLIFGENYSLTGCEWTLTCCAAGEYRIRAAYRLPSTSHNPPWTKSDWVVVKVEE